MTPWPSCCNLKKKKKKMREGRRMCCGEKRKRQKNKNKIKDKEGIWCWQAWIGKKKIWYIWTYDILV